MTSSSSLKRTYSTRRSKQQMLPVTLDQGAASLPGNRLTEA
ncbi:hypothetical protein A2U01_0090886, partial [Trifolium medium]|nr:hypothetical protein [Trifolium medium]